MERGETFSTRVPWIQKTALWSLYEVYLVGWEPLPVACVTLFWLLLAKCAITLHITFGLNPHFTSWFTQGGNPVTVTKGHLRCLSRKASRFHCCCPSIETDAAEVLSLFLPQSFSPVSEPKFHLGGPSGSVAARDRQTTTQAPVTSSTSS